MTIIFGVLIPFAYTLNHKIGGNSLPLNNKIYHPQVVADPGFPRRDTNARESVNLLFGKLFAENCMKMKEIWLKGHGCLV